MNHYNHNTPLFCPPTPLRLPPPHPRLLTPSCTCSATPNRNPQPVSRRAALVALGGIALQFLFPKSHPAKAADNAAVSETEAPLTGFLTRSGIKFFDFQTGEGRTPKWGDLVNIQYVAYTLTPAGDALIKQDSSYRYGNHGYLVHHGNGQLILGVEEMIHSMRVGGRRRAIIPAQMAYTHSGLGPVPLWDGVRRKFSKALKDGDGTVVFDIEVRSIEEYPPSQANYTDPTPSAEQVSAYLQDQISTLD